MQTNFFDHLQGGASAWEKAVGGAQDLNVSLRIVHGEAGWDLPSLRLNAAYKLWQDNQKKLKTQQEYGHPYKASPTLRIFPPGAGNEKRPLTVAVSRTRGSLRSF